MYTLKSIAQRSAAIGSAVALVAAIAVLPLSAYAEANTLNPLTQRSLTLSSSSPGWAFTDGSGNTTYAPPNSGANGQKTGETFSFVTSSDGSSATGTPIEAFTFQYCTNPAGDCIAPGNDVGAVGSRTDSVANQQADLNVVTSSPSEMPDATYAALSTNSQTSASDDGVTNYSYTGLPNADNSQGNFIVLVDNAGTLTPSDGWSMEASSVETTATTGKNNYITLYNTTGASIPARTRVQVIFYATNTNYITNPGSGAFFVKINDYTGTTGTAPSIAADPSKLLDGGVTVANVMNQSIQITTKVLETMQFSVGTVDPDTLTDTQLTAAGGASKHTQCDKILPSMTAGSNINVLTMGDSTAENSLSTQHTYSTHSFWRLSSNSSAGATVYYSGNTLADTEGDTIAAMGTTAGTPIPGSPQFGLALDNAATTPYGVDFTTTEGVAGTGLFEQGADGNPTGVDASFTTDNTGKADVNQNQLSPLLPATQYANGDGTVNKEYTAGGTGTPSATFAFDDNSTAVPVPLASESTKVVDCVTGKVRYVANIAATTPAGIYTTKINYIAAPQY